MRTQLCTRYLTALLDVTWNVELRIVDDEFAPQQMTTLQRIVDALRSADALAARFCAHCDERLTPNGWRAIDRRPVHAALDVRTRFLFVVVFA